MSQNNQQIHFIAIGGSLMHNLALALQKKGITVTGSDDELFEPSMSKLERAGLLPGTMGWDPQRIHEDLDAVILGMHAHADNPELARANALQIPVYSFPEFIYLQSVNKQRIVIAGSHGKSTITAMIIHVMRSLNRSFDFAIGAEIENFDLMVHLSDAPVIIIEGDEYLSSALDKKPKFLHYHHHIGLISGIAWDHVNVFPSEADYIRQFEEFSGMTPKAGTLIYNGEDPRAATIGSKEREDVTGIPYATPRYDIRNHITYLSTENGDVELQIFGRHNMLNLMGAKAVLNRIGVTDLQFFEQIGSFKGASRRLELVGQGQSSQIFRDYAHAPSKVRATVSAFKEHHTEKKLVACLELHTFSSLTESFLSRYKDTMSDAEERIVYFNPETVRHKRLPELNPDMVRNAFADQNLKVFTGITSFLDHLKSLSWKNTDLLLMSSGTFDNLDIQEIEKILQ